MKRHSKEEKNMCILYTYTNYSVATVGDQGNDK